jgi:hypothetical protein
MAFVFRYLGAAAAAATALSAGQAGASAYDRFDAAAAHTPAERLVLCDTTAFVASRPDLNAQRMVLRRTDGVPVILLPPYFVSGGFLYSERYDRVFVKMRRAHQTSVGEVRAAQAGLGRALVELYRNGRWVDTAFAARQDRFCRGFAASYGVRGGW